MFAGWVLVDAALSPAVVALLQLLVVEVLNTCFLLCICAAALIQHAPMLLASSEQTLVLASVPNLPIMIGACFRAELAYHDAQDAARLAGRVGFHSQRQ